VPVRRLKARYGEGIVKVELERRSGMVELHRPDGTVGELTQPGQPTRRVALQRRPVRDCLAEELRRLDADEIYEQALKSLSKIDRRARPAATTKTAPTKTATTDKPSAKTPAKSTAAAAKTPAKARAKSAAKTPAKSKAGAGS
jgi:hypothetical protein